ncbi:MAG: hypothetical protein LBL23_02675 [Coriobacteriales bacterium]|nr:hypothetical protein [Coriobacteriales bacterium]
MKSIFFDMDGVLVDYAGGRAYASQYELKIVSGDLARIPGIFARLDPLPGALDAVAQLSRSYECHVLSTAPWENSSAWTDKVNWIFKYFGSSKDSAFFQRINITHDKGMFTGDYLIDDRAKHGVVRFSGEWIEFGSSEFPNWQAVLDYLL